MKAKTETPILITVLTNEQKDKFNQALEKLSLVNANMNTDELEEKGLEIYGMVYDRNLLLNSSFKSYLAELYSRLNYLIRAKNFDKSILKFNIKIATENLQKVVQAC